MEYRVIMRLDEGVEYVKTFESAYDAVDFVLALWHRGEARAQNLRIVDSEGSTLLESPDLAGITFAGEAA